MLFHACEIKKQPEESSLLFFLFTFNQIADPSEIEKIVDRVIANNPKQLEQYRGGKTKLQGYFAGQVRL